MGPKRVMPPTMAQAKAVRKAEARQEVQKALDLSDLKLRNCIFCTNLNINIDDKK